MEKTAGRRKKQVSRGGRKMMMKVETVTGPIALDQLGKTLSHEHFVFGYPGYNGDSTLGRFDYNHALTIGIQVAEKIMKHGVKTVLDPTPNECGRNVRLLRDISIQTGLQIVCGTGFYYEGEGATPYFKARAALGPAEEEIYEMFITELQNGIEDTGIKPGFIKLASSKNVITDYEKMFFRAAARAHKETGTIILTHTQEGTMGPEQADLLIELGVDPDCVVIGHMCGNTDVEYHRRTLEKGVRIGFDRIGLQGLAGCPTDQERLAVLVELLKEGFENRIFLAHDSVNIWLGRELVVPEAAIPSIANWHPTHIFENIVPQLRSLGITEQQLEILFTENIKSLFSISSKFANK